MPDQLTERLWWSEHGDEARVLVGSERDHEPLLSFEARGHRMAMRMVMLEGRRLVDVSFHPAVATHLLTSHARRHRANPNGWVGAVTTALLRFAGGNNLPVGERGPEGSSCLTALLGGLTHPLLGAAYERGATPLDEIPRWASPMLAMPSPRDAARQAFGAAGTRPVVASLAAALAPTDNDPPRTIPALRAVGFALAAATCCEADHLARILRADTERPAPSEWPSRTTLAMLGTVADQLPSQQTASLFVEALETPDGAVQLLKAARVFRQVEPLFERAPSGRLDRFVRECLAHASLDPGPTRRRVATADDVPQPRDDQHRRRPRPGGPATARASAAAPARQDRPARRQRLVAPRLRPDPARRAFLEPERFDYRPEIQSLHGAKVGDYSLTLPRSPGELTEWSRILRNCLDIFPRPIAEGRCVVLGIRRREGLVGAVEFRPNERRIHQAEAVGGRPLDTKITRALIALLAERGLLDATASLPVSRRGQPY